MMSEQLAEQARAIAAAAAAVAHTSEELILPVPDGQQDGKEMTADREND